MTLDNSFSPGVAHQLGHYVYLLIDSRPDVNEIFYVGKGTGKRAESHLEAARRRQSSGGSCGKYPKLAYIRKIGIENVSIEILAYGLRDDDEAFAVETAAIDLLNFKKLTNVVHGHASKLKGRTPLRKLNAQFGARRLTLKEIGNHRVVFIRVAHTFNPGEDDRKLYEATRKWWVIAAKRRSLGEETAPEFAVAIHGGVVYGVFRIERWTQRRVTEDGRRTRWAFVGTRDSKMEKRLMNRDVSGLMPQGDQWPLRFFNCKA